MFQYPFFMKGEKMKKFKVNIREISEKVVEVNATSEEEALEMAEKLYDNQDIMLGYQDMKDTEFSIF